MTKSIIQERFRCFVGEADRGYCAAKKMSYYGFKLGLRIARSGMIVHYPLLAARPNDVKHLFALVTDGICERAK